VREGGLREVCAFDEKVEMRVPRAGIPVVGELDESTAADDTFLPERARTEAAECDVEAT
jgi:hypothetical protein